MIPHNHGTGGPCSMFLVHTTCRTTHATHLAILTTPASSKWSKECVNMACKEGLHTQGAKHPAGALCSIRPRVVKNTQPYEANSLIRQQPALDERSCQLLFYSRASAHRCVLVLDHPQLDGSHQPPPLVSNNIPNNAPYALHPPATIHAAGRPACTGHSRGAMRSLPLSSCVCDGVETTEQHPHE